MNALHLTGWLVLLALIVGGFAALAVLGDRLQGGRTLADDAERRALRRGRR